MTQKKQLGDLLVEAGIITVKTLERALSRQTGSGKRLGMVLEEMGVLTDEELVNALARQFGFKTVKEFACRTYPWDLLCLVPEDMAVQKLVFPLQVKDGVLAVAITDPFDNDTLDYLAKKTKMKIFPVLATPRDLHEAIKAHYLGGKEPPEDRQTILVVDDSQAIATIIEVALIKAGYNVLVAHDGLLGLKMALANLPDLIICDEVMPRLDGYGLLNAIRNNPQTVAIPLILLTSKSSGEDEQKAFDSGFLDFISKPVQPIRVVTRVKRALELMKSIGK